MMWCVYCGKVMRFAFCRLPFTPMSLLQWPHTTRLCGKSLCLLSEKEHWKMDILICMDSLRFIPVLFNKMTSYYLVLVCHLFESTHQHLLRMANNLKYFSLCNWDYRWVMCVIFLQWTNGQTFVSIIFPYRIFCLLNE